MPDLLGENIVLPHKIKVKILILCGFLLYQNNQMEPTIYYYNLNCVNLVVYSPILKADSSLSFNNKYFLILDGEEVIYCKKVA